MNNSQVNRKLLIATAPWIFVFLWSTGFIGAKYTTAYSDTFYLLFLRAFATCLVFVLLAGVLQVRWPGPSAAFQQMFTGFLTQTMFLGGCFYSISLGMPAAITSLITGMQPILTALIITFVYKQSFKPRQWLGILLGFSGMYLVLNPTASHGYQLALPAIVASVIGLIGITLGTIYQKSVRSDGHPLTQVFYQSLSLTISMGILTLLFEEQQIQWTLSLALGLSWLVIVLGVCATLLLMFMIKSGESTKVATYFYLVPAFTATESWLLFDQSISRQSLIGMCASILGLILVVRYAKSENNEKGEGVAISAREVSD